MTAQDVLTRVGWEIGQDGSKLLFSSTSAVVKQLLQIMYAAGEDIAGRTEWQALHKEVSIDGSLSQYTLPANFRELREHSGLRGVVSGGGYKPIIMVQSPEQWDLITSRPSAQSYAFITGGKIKFSPDTGDGVKMSYVSKFWNLNGGGSVTSGTEQFGIPENLLVRGMVWRWRRQKGLEFTDLHSEFEADLVEAISADRGVA